VRLGVIGERFGHNANVADPRLAKRIHQERKSSEGNGLVATEKYAFVRLFQLGLNFPPKVIHVDGIIAQKNVLILVHGDYDFLFGYFVRSFRFGNVDFDTGLQNGSGDHEDDQEDEDDVDERDHVDLGQRRLRFGDLRHKFVRGRLERPQNFFS
jgi:hypothetical protein